MNITFERKKFFDFLSGEKTIAFTGAGGKTTTMFFLADISAKQNLRVIVTTTTKMMKPKHMVSTVEEAEKYWNSATFAAAGSFDPLTGKIGFPEDSVYKNISEAADLVLIEADGSKRLPAKAPREGEPVILNETDAVICVMGMSAIGQKTADVCFGLKEAFDILGITDPEQIFTADMAAKILSSSVGGRKNTENKIFAVLLNQCDTPDRITAAEEIRRRLSEENIPVFFQTYTEEERRRYGAMANDITL